MDKFIIHGGAKLKGEVTISKAKNAILSIIAGSLLAEGKTILHDVPKLKDVTTICEIITRLGVKVEYIEGGALAIDTTELSGYEAPYDLVKTMRASFLVMGPLLARMKKARVSRPGGCAFGPRPVNYHLKGFSSLGVEISEEHGYIQGETNKLKGANIYLDFPTVTGTENIMMAAVLAEGTTVIENSAKEPEVMDLAHFLKKMGADMEGEGTGTITIKGVDKLNPVDYSAIPDRIEAATFIMAAGITKGNIKIKGIKLDHLRAVISKLEDMGISMWEEGDVFRVVGPPQLNPIKVTTLPFPGFPTDLQPLIMALTTIAKGTSMITETVYKSRFIHIGEFARMGADIDLDGKSAVVRGVEKLTGSPVMANDLRAGAALVLAGLVAEGTTEVNRIYHIDRGYEHFEDKLSQLGASIERVRE